MKTALALFIVATFICFASGKPKYPPLGDFKTQSGKAFKNAKINNVAGDHISIIHEGGISRVYFDDIPKELSKKLGLNKGTVDAAKKEREKAKREAKEQQLLKLKDGPFGLWSGMSVEEANAVGPKRADNQYGKFYKLSKKINSPFPYTHWTIFKKKNSRGFTATFRRLNALFDPKMGLVAIETIGGLPRKESKKKYSEIILSLTKKYGATLVKKNEKVKAITSENELITTIWPTKSRPQGVWDVSVSWREQTGSILGDTITIRYWFVPKKTILDSVAKDEANQKAAEKLKAKDKLNDL
jgi:hypothetical protein